MRPIDLLSSRYNSIKPKGHDGGSSRWRARPVMTAAVLLLMSLAVLLPRYGSGRKAPTRQPTGLHRRPRRTTEEASNWTGTSPHDTNIEEYEYSSKRKRRRPVNPWLLLDIYSATAHAATQHAPENSLNDNSYLIPADGRTVGRTYEVRLRAMYTSGSADTFSPPSATVEVKAGPAAVTMPRRHRRPPVRHAELDRFRSRCDPLRVPPKERRRYAWGDWKDSPPAAAIDYTNP